MQWSYKNDTSGDRLLLCSGDLIYLLFNPKGFLGNLSLFVRDHQAPQATSDKFSACLLNPLSPAVYRSPPRSWLSALHTFEIAYVTLQDPGGETTIMLLGYRQRFRPRFSLTLLDRIIHFWVNWQRQRVKLINNSWISFAFTNRGWGGLDRKGHISCPFW